MMELQSLQAASDHTELHVPGLFLRVQRRLSEQCVHHILGGTGAPGLWMAVLSTVEGSQGECCTVSLQPAV